MFYSVLVPSIRVLNTLPNDAWDSYLLKHFSMCLMAVLEWISWPQVTQYIELSSSFST